MFLFVSLSKSHTSTKCFLLCCFQLFSVCRWNPWRGVCWFWWLVLKLDIRRNFFGSIGYTRLSGLRRSRFDLCRRIRTGTCRWDESLKIWFSKTKKNPRKPIKQKQNQKSQKHRKPPNKTSKNNQKPASIFTNFLYLLYTSGCLNKPFLPPFLPTDISAKSDKTCYRYKKLVYNTPWCRYTLSGPKLSATYNRFRCNKHRF